MKKLFEEFTESRKVVVPEGTEAKYVAHQVDPLHDVDKCVIARGIHFQPDEDSAAKIGRVISALADVKVTPVKAIRLNSQNESQPPLVKIAFSSHEDKISA